jgi:hypothetical protein
MRRENERRKGTELRSHRLVQLPIKGGWNYAALLIELSHLAITLATDFVDH